MFFECHFIGTSDAMMRNGFNIGGGRIKYRRDKRGYKHKGVLKGVGR